jgi:hypothetical protein
VSASAALFAGWLTPKEEAGDGTREVVPRDKGGREQSLRDGRRRRQHLDVVICSATEKVGKDGARHGG